MLDVPDPSPVACPFVSVRNTAGPGNPRHVAAAIFAINRSRNSLVHTLENRGGAAMQSHITP